MRQPIWIKEAIKLGNKFTVQKNNVIKNNFINVSMALILWATIFLVYYSSLWLPAWVFLPMSIFALGYLYYCQLILLVHEGGMAPL